MDIISCKLYLLASRWLARNWLTLSLHQYQFIVTGRQMNKKLTVMKWLYKDITGLTTPMFWKASPSHDIFFSRVGYVWPESADAHVACMLNISSLTRRCFFKLDVVSFDADKILTLGWHNRHWTSILAPLSSLKMKCLLYFHRVNAFFSIAHDCSVLLWLSDWCNDNELLNTPTSREGKQGWENVGRSGMLLSLSSLRNRWWFRRKTKNHNIQAAA